MDDLNPADADRAEAREELRRELRRLLGGDDAGARTRAAMETADRIDAGLWKRLVDELGILGLTVPEGRGGAGAGAEEAAVVLEEIGRWLTPVPYLSSLLAVEAVLAVEPGPVAADLLDRLVSGDLRATCVAPTDPPREARRTPAGWSMTGSVDVLDGAGADRVLVVARAGSALVLLAVGTGPTGTAVRRLSTYDPTRTVGRLDLDGVVAEQVGTVAPDRFEHLQRLAMVAVAAEQLGGATRCVELSVDYAKTRVQFGQPIGRFQAVKHRIADAFVQTELTRALVVDGARALAGRATGPDDLAVRAAAAKAAASRTYTEVAAQCIQNHGGIGYTWEHDAHLYFKRAHTTAQLCGSPTACLDLVADRTGGPR